MYDSRKDSYFNLISNFNSFKATHENKLKENNYKNGSSDYQLYLYQYACVWVGINNKRGYVKTLTSRNIKLCKENVTPIMLKFVMKLFGKLTCSVD